METAARAYLEQGLWGVLATPFTGDPGPVDFTSLQRQVELHGRAGSVGLVALGVFGEAVKLDADEQVAVVKAVTEAVPGRRTVVGLSGLVTAEVIAAARRLADAASSPPVLMVQVNSGEVNAVVDHLGAIHDATALDIVLQDYPVASGVRIEATEVARIAVLSPAVVAVKSEAPPTTPAIATISALTEVPVFGGLGGLGLLDELSAGAAGAMTGFSFPEVLAAVVAAFREGGFAAAAEVFVPYLPLVNFEAQVGVGLAIRKASLQLRGVFASGAVRSPGQQMTGALEAILVEHLRRLPREWLT